MADRDVSDRPSREGQIVGNVVSLLSLLVGLITLFDGSGSIKLLLTAASFIIFWMASDTLRNLTARSVRAIFPTLRKSTSANLLVVLALVSTLIIGISVGLFSPLRFIKGSSSRIQAAQTELQAAEAELEELDAKLSAAHLRLEMAQIRLQAAIAHLGAAEDLHSSIYPLLISSVVNRPAMSFGVITKTLNTIDEHLAAANENLEASSKWLDEAIVSSHEADESITRISIHTHNAMEILDGSSEAQSNSRPP
jgi:hypothetical protein